MSELVESDNFLVLNGKPNAVILLGQRPTRSASFAAKELQNYIHKISGALLPITTETNDVDKVLNKDSSNIKTSQNIHPFKIYVGQSNAVNKLQLPGDQLKWGGYQIASGKNWLALIGDDFDFRPIGFTPVRRNQWEKTNKLQWEKETNFSDWENEVEKNMWNKYNSSLDLWIYDHKGSLNAVYGFLRHLGVRWFMAGDLGEHVPQMESIALPKINEVKNPHYNIRKASFMRYGINHAKDDVLWSLRQGMHDPYGFDIYHGMAAVTRSEKNRKNHPEFYALYNGKRATSGKTPEHCLSSEGLFEENLRYIKTMFDKYDLPAISVMPDDGYAKICECHLCKGKDTPERGVNGKMSDYVWEYVNKLAIEVEKTHPDKYIIGGAYSAYFLPPEKIEQLNSNVMVHLVNGRRRFNDLSLIKGYSFSQKERVEIAKKWSDLTAGKVINFMNFGGAANTPNIFAEDIKATKDYFIGEDMWVEHFKGGLAKKGFNHLNYYMTARLWWNPELNIDSLFEDYYKLFYGPAANEMRALIDFYEVNQQYFGQVKNKHLLEKCFSLYDNAVSKVEENSIYAKRVSMFNEGLEKHRLRYKQMLSGRENVPSHRANMPSRWASELKLDGVLNEDCWKYLNGKLFDNASGAKLKYSTRFKLGYTNNYLYVGIESKFEPGKKLISSSNKKDDENIWNGDYIDLLIETPSQSFYQISINPTGSVTDVDHSSNWGLRWDSEIEVASKVDTAKGIWHIEAKIPVTTSQQDPLHEIVGRPPKRKDFPWYFNLCRKINYNGKIEYSAFSPTESDSFLVKEKFAELTR